MNIRRVYITESAVKHRLVDEFRAALPDAQFQQVADADEVPLPDEPCRRFVFAKRSLLLDVHPGLLLRPLTRPYGEDRPEYYLYAETGCLFDCQYCFLQEWLSTPLPTVFVNREHLADQVEEVLAQHDSRLYLHAGEVADALALDPITGLSETLIALANAHPGLRCELRTKSDAIERLLKSNAVPQNLVVSWSLSPAESIRRFEPRTASLARRLAAIEAVSARGYAVALRLDPIVSLTSDPMPLVAMLHDVAAVMRRPPVSITVGSMRMTAPCLRIARMRFPESSLFAGELVRSIDGKYRFSGPLRRTAFRAVAETALQLWGIEVDYCMEPQ